ncbi:GNAT family N-acetyltransferase [Streptomyces sp. NPDC017979]|uniref:GNAT family N-acetyltransferase n=1 Tax=Streptomyces sp. NPDC017979 TaxID=3365024 RepID=UPI003793290E
MRPDDWHLTQDLHHFLSRARGFLHARPALHTLPLTVTETLRAQGADAYGPDAPVFGWLERSGEVRAAFFRTPPRRLTLTPLDPGGAESLAALLAELAHPLPGVTADHDTAVPFAAAWQRATGVTAVLQERHRLYRLGELSPSQPPPAGRGRVAGVRDRDLLVRWYREFGAAIGRGAGQAPGTWADVRIADRRVTLWEGPDGTPAAMAAVSPMVAGQVRVAPVYTPAHLRGLGYAGAVTAEAGRAALAAGATDVVLFADLTNPTSNGLYRRIGYRPVADFTMYDFTTEPEPELKSEPA